jgi:hypothetical protein
MHGYSTTEDVTSTFSSTESLEEQVEQLKHFLATAPHNWDPAKFTRKFMLPNNDSISCANWKGVFHITGTDIIRALIFRFQAYGRPVKNFKKFEEGVFSDLRNLKPGVDATLESPRSEFLEMLYKHNCIRTQKKQKVFYWYSVPHEKLFMDALERDLKREALGVAPTTVPVSGYEDKQTPHRLMANNLPSSDSNPQSAPAHSMGFDRMQSSKLHLNMEATSSYNVLPVGNEPHSADPFHSSRSTYDKQSRSQSAYPASAHPLSASSSAGFSSLLPPLDTLHTSSTSNTQTFTDSPVDYSQLLGNSFYLPLSSQPTQQPQQTTRSNHTSDSLYSFFPNDHPSKRRTIPSSLSSSQKYSPYGYSHEESRFPCTYHGCNMRFKRFDLLQNHQKSHMS